MAEMQNVKIIFRHFDNSIFSLYMVGYKIYTLGDLITYLRRFCHRLPPPTSLWVVCPWFKIDAHFWLQNWPNIEKYGKWNFCKNDIIVATYIGKIEGKFWSKIEILFKNEISKIEILFFVKNQNFVQKSKLSSNNEIFVRNWFFSSKIEIFVRNWFFFLQNSKFCSKIEILFKNRNSGQKSKFS